MQKLVSNNDDYCAACLGKGRLLCCDSCPRVFHFCCVEEGFDVDEHIEGLWECKSCAFKRVLISYHILLISCYSTNSRNNHRVRIKNLAYLLKVT